MNLSRWQPGDGAAFVFWVLFGALIGGMAGAGHFDPYEKFYWLHVGLWALMGLGAGILAGAVRQLLRNRT